MWSYAHGERLQDRLVWMELRWFGFTKLLRTRVATNSGDELTDAARTALSTMIQGHAKTVVRYLPMPVCPSTLALTTG